MDLSDSLQDTLEDLNAMILATDPDDRKAVAHLGECLSAIVQAMEPTAPSAKLLTLGLSGLRNIEKFNGPTALNAVAFAVAASSQHLCGADEQSLAALEMAAVAIRELLEPQELQDASQAPVPAGVDRPDANAASDSEIHAGTEMLSPGWEKELIPTFLAEARDHMATAEAAILSLEVYPNDSESINTVLRAFHTIKGSAGLVGISRIQALAHEAENLLIRARDGTIQMAHGNIDLALKSCDAIKFMLDQVETVSPGEEATAPENLEQLLKALSGAEVSDAAAKEDEQRTPSEAVPASQGNNTDKETSAQPSKTTAPVGDTTIRVNTGRLDELVNWVGALVIAHSILAQDASVIKAFLLHLANNF